MENVKKYIFTALTLGLIAAGGALFIATTNMITRGPIAENEKKAINKGIASIFDDYEHIYYSSEEDVKKDNDNNPYVDHIYYVKDGLLENDENNVVIGYALRTTGSNQYGKLSLIVGFDTSYAYVGLSVVTNEQSFASTLNKNYIIPVQKGERELDKVSCGATYGATTIRDMVNNAKNMVKTIVGGNNG